jgi:hypothetical protein
MAQRFKLHQLYAICDFSGKPIDDVLFVDAADGAGVISALERKIGKRTYVLRDLNSIVVSNSLSDRVSPAFEAAIKGSVDI